MKKKIERKTSLKSEWDWKGERESKSKNACEFGCIAWDYFDSMPETTVKLNNTWEFSLTC